MNLLRTAVRLRGHDGVWLTFFANQDRFCRQCEFKPLRLISVFVFKAALISVVFLFGATGCAELGSTKRLAPLVEQARTAGFEHLMIQAGGFELTSYVRQPVIFSNARKNILTIYIEGDGAPWPTPFSPPNDPTPLRPVALALAVADPSAFVAYLGRPCQYLSAVALRECDSAWWVEKRFAPQVITAYDAAVDRLKTLSTAARVRLVGYSGGGVIAVLLAAQRHDVDAVVTVAAPLSVQQWLAGHGASPLTGSLDPDVSIGKGDLPQSVYFVGEHDEIVPPSVVRGFAQRKGGRVVVVTGFEHECCWSRDWLRLLRENSIWEVGK